MAKAGGKRNGYKMPAPIANGEIIEDLNKKQWKIGPSIGKGGFGEIYSVLEIGTSKKNDYVYVAKIEPHENGPLFVEMNYYIRNAKKTDLEAFKKKKGIKSLGLAEYVASGSHEYKGVKYRFLVLERFGKNLWDLFLENNRAFPAATVYKIGLQILDALEYVHERGYVHGDIKGANLLLGSSKSSQNQVYLVDFGLAGRYSTAKQFKADTKKSHNGTIEYLSLDNHSGVLTRRGDLEILVYNLIQWLGCTLPWENVKDVKVVQEKKKTYMDNVAKFLEICFISETPPDAIKKYLEYLNSLDFNTTPDYNKLRDILKSGLKQAKGTPSSPLKFKTSPLKRRNDDVLGDGAVKEKKKKASKKLEYNKVEENLKSEQSDNVLLAKETKATKKKASTEATNDNIVTSSVVSNRPKRNLKSINYKEA